MGNFTSEVYVGVTENGLTREKQFFKKIYVMFSQLWGSLGLCLIGLETVSVSGHLAGLWVPN